MKTRTLLAAAALLLAVSCSKSELESPQGPGTPNTTPVTLSLSSAPSGSATFGDQSEQTQQNDTKSSTELPQGTTDGQVHDLWALQYDAAGALVGTPYYTATIPAGTAGGAGSGTDYTYSGLSLNLTSSGAATHTLYFVANTGNGTLFTVDNDVTTKDKFIAATQAIGTEYQPTAGSGLPMLGTYAGIVASGTPITGVKMERTIAKVNLKYKVSISGFTVTGVQLRNVPKTISYFGHQSAVDFPLKNTTPGSESHIDYPSEDLTKAGIDGDYKTYTWYLPENYRKATSAVSAVGDRTLDKTDGMATYVEIRGMLREGDRARKATLHVLLGDIATAMGDFNVKRNTVYTATVDLKGLNSGDYRLTIEDYDMSNSAMILPAAVAGAPRDSVTFDIRKCLSNGFTIASDLKTLMAGTELCADVLWQDGNIVNTADVSLDRVNGLLTVRSSKTDMGNAIVALYPKASKLQGEILWSWHIWVTDYQPSDAGFATRTPNTAYDLPGTGQVHTYGTQFQKANGTSRVIMDRNLGATAAAYAPPTTVAEAAKTFGFLYQWGRKDPFPQWDGQSSGPTADADAKTIKIYGPDGTSELAEGAKDNTSELGYKKINVTAAMGAANTLAYATKNPLAVIYSTSHPYDWYTDVNNTANQRNDLWGNGGPKGAYDPCPKGWRVPPVGTWDDVGTNVYAAPFFYYINGTQQMGLNNPITFVQSGRNGRLYEVDALKVWYPAPGYRERAHGESAAVGSTGYYWASSVSIVSAHYLGFSSTWLPFRLANYRAFGFPVRCVQYWE